MVVGLDAISLPVCLYGPAVHQCPGRETLIDHHRPALPSELVKGPGVPADEGLHEGDGDGSLTPLPVSNEATLDPQHILGPLRPLAGEVLGVDEDQRPSAQPMPNANPMTVFPAPQGATAIPSPASTIASTARSW